MSLEEPMTGKVVHFEVPFDDADRARALISWSTENAADRHAFDNHDDLARLG